MPLDREDPDYRAIKLLMDEPLLSRLDEYIETTVGIEAVLDRISKGPLSGSQKARLRIALWFWTGRVKLDIYDLFKLDEENRGRFLEALKLVLGVK